MKIEYFKLDSSDKSDFDDFLPQDVFARMSLSTTFAYVAVDNEATDKDDPRAGIIVFSSDKRNEVMVEWLYVNPAYRGKFIGTGLLRYVFSAARGANKEFIRLVLKDDFAQGECADAVKGFFEANGFYEIVSEYHEWNLLVSDINMKYFDKIPAGKNIISFKDAEKDKFAVMMTDYYGANPSKSYPDMNLIDEEASCVLMDNNRMIAAFLVQVSEDEIRPLMRNIENIAPERIVEMFAFGAKVTKKKYSGDTMLRMCTDVYKIYRPIKYLFPKESPVCVLEAYSGYEYGSECIDTDFEEFEIDMSEFETTEIENNSEMAW